MYTHLSEMNLSSDELWHKSEIPTVALKVKSQPQTIKDKDGGLLPKNPSLFPKLLLTFHHFLPPPQSATDPISFVFAGVPSSCFRPNVFSRRHLTSARDSSPRL